MGNDEIQYLTGTLGLNPVQKRTVVAISGWLWEQIQQCEMVYRADVVEPNRYFVYCLSGSAEVAWIEWLASQSAWASSFVSVAGGPPRPAH